MYLAIPLLLIQEYTKLYYPHYLYVLLPVYRVHQSILHFVYTNAILHYLHMNYLRQNHYIHL